MEVKPSRMTGAGIVAETDFIVRWKGCHLNDTVRIQVPELYVLAEATDGYRVAKLGGELREDESSAGTGLEALDETSSGGLLDELYVQ